MQISRVIRQFETRTACRRYERKEIHPRRFQNDCPPSLSGLSLAEQSHEEGRETQDLAL